MSGVKKEEQDMPSAQALGATREASNASSSSATPGTAMGKRKSTPKINTPGSSPAHMQGAKRKHSSRSNSSQTGDADTANGSPLPKKDSFHVDDMVDVPTPQVSSGEEDGDSDTEETHDAVGDMVAIASSRQASKQEVLERKATLEPEFMKMLTIPDEEDESAAESKLFETNQTTMLENARGSSFTAPRKTGFESWLKSKTSARQLYNTGDEGKPLLVFKNVRMEVVGRKSCVPTAVRHHFQNCFRECLDLGVDDHSKSFKVLRGVSGVMMAGKTTLILGPPGAGLTSLLRVLSGRVNPQEHIEYDMLQTYDDGNVDPKDRLMRRRCAFVSADDRPHLPTLTVRETMEFAARLTMPWKEGEAAETREKDIDELVTRVIESLGLSEQVDTIIGGDDLRGVSGGQKRRCSLGEMLFSRDTKLLFLDDLTNGLDSSKAQQVIRIIRSACRVLGFSALVSLLQPNDMLFDAFDEVLVLSSNGEMAFAGPTNEAVPYFEALLERTHEDNDEVRDWTRPSGMSSAEYILMAVSNLGEVLEAKPELGTFADRFLKSRDGARFTERIQVAETQLAQSKHNKTQLKAYATPAWEQFKCLVRRKLLLITRNPMTLRRVLVAIAFGIVIGTLFSSLDQGMVGSLGRAGFIFLTIFLVFMLSTAVTVPDNHSMRLVFFKQHGAAFHSVIAFYLANLVCDFPLSLVEALLLSIIPYWWVDMRTSDAGGFFYFFAILLAMELVGQASSRLISALSPTVVLAQLFASGYILLCGLVGGFMPHYSGIPPWWQWMNWLNPVGYAFEGLILNNYMAGGQANATYPALVVPINGTNTDLGTLTGAEVASALGAPRVPFENAPAGLNDPGKVMAFDFGMLLVFAFLLDMCGVVALKKSHDWYEPWSRRSIQTTSTTSTRKEIQRVLQGIKAQFLSLKLEEFGTVGKGETALADPAMVTKEPTESAIPSQTLIDNHHDADKVDDDDVPSPLTLSIVDISYFVKDAPHKPLPAAEAGETTETGSKAKATPAQFQCMSRLAFPEVFRLSNKTRAGEDLRLSFTRLYSACLLRLDCCGSRKHRPRAGNEDADDESSDVLPPEERIHLTVHRPRSGSKRGRAWSNKLPFGEEEDAGPDGRQQDEIQLLHSVTAYFRSGEMTALMGQSGCGKTTLMDVIAGYKTEGRIRGDIFVNGQKPDPAKFRRYLGYAEQVDLHIPTLSVKESLVFAASCRLPRTYSREKIMTTVRKVVSILQLEEFENMIVGDEDAAEGLPKHARKRLTIGVELVAKPRVLFLDEPTTALDSLGAEIVVEALAKAKKELQICIVATIHQPSRAVFGRFDRLLFLQKGGFVLYHGAISSFKPFDEASPPEMHPVNEGESQDEHNETSKDWMQVHVIQRQPSGLQPIDENAIPAMVVIADMRPAPTIADTVLAYFAGLGAPPLKQGFNPADHLLLAVDTLVENGVDVADLYEESKEKKQVWEVIAQETKNPQALPQALVHASFCTQLGLLCKRYFTAQWRDPRFTFFRFAWYAFSAMFIGTIFFRLGCGINDTVYRIAALFFAVYTAVIPMQVAVVPLVKERAVVYREHMSGTYSAWADGIARFLVDIPFHAVNAVLFYAIFYYAVRLSTIPEKTGYFVLMIFFTFWTITSFGQMTALLSPNIETANGMAGLVILLSTFLMGFLIPVKLMPDGWKWAVWINMLYYILQGLCVNELNGEMMQVNFGNTTVPCGTPPPLGQFNTLSLASESAPHATAYDSLRDTGVALRGSVVASAANATLPPLFPNCSGEFATLRTKFENLHRCSEKAGCADSPDMKLCLMASCTLEITAFIRALSNVNECLPAGLKERIAEILPCLIAAGGDINEIIKCIPHLEELLELLKRFIEILRYLLPIFPLEQILDWILYIIAYQVVYIPSNVVLWFFGWAQQVPGQGFVADTQWWYCMFALCMFLASWEIIKLFARRYVIWVRR